MQPLPPPLLRTLYRKLLRASQFGKHPEVFGHHGSYVWLSSQTHEGEMAGEPAWPADAAGVRQLIRHPFDAPATPANKDGDSIPINGASCTEATTDAPLSEVHRDPFAGLRTAHALSVLAPQAKELPETLPIFDFGGVLLLPGEETQFKFFEERYKLLCRIAMGKEGGERPAAAEKDANGAKKKPTAAGGYFLLRAGRAQEWATLVKILDSAENPRSGEWIVRVIGGPRVSIARQDLQEVDCPADPLTRATRFTLLYDEADATAEELAAATAASGDGDVDIAKNFSGSADGGSAAEIAAKHSEVRLDVLRSLGALTDLPRVLRSTGLPPIDPEMFSFWALRFVIPPNDAPARLRWLGGCHSTTERMAHVHNLLCKFAEAKESQDERQANEAAGTDASAAADGAPEDGSTAKAEAASASAA